MTPPTSQPEKTTAGWFALLPWFGRAPRSISSRVKPTSFPSTIELPPKPIYDLVCRAYNLLVASVGILLVSPLMIGIALAVKITDPGPALYRGKRVGKGEKPFDIFKFRTMKVGSEQKIGKRLVKQGENHFTPIGKFLRKYRLDELAQLLNVLRGDMNLVGPRPLRPIFLEDHKAKIPGYARRFTVRPGITGRAQVQGGYYTTPRHKLFYELLYIKHRGLLLDVQLIVLTFLRVMTRIFTTVVLFAWLLLMVLVLPESWQAMAEVRIGGVQINLIYLVPTLIVIAKLVRREGASGNIHALRTPVDLPILGFVLVSAAIIPFSRFPMTATRGLLFYVCNGIVVFYLVANSRLAHERRGPFIATLVGAVGLMSLVAVGEMAWLAYAKDAAVRLSSPLMLGTVIVLTLPLAIARLRNVEGRWKTGYYAFMALGLLVTAGLTLSRSGVLAVALALFVFFWRISRRIALGACIFAGLVVLGLGLAGDDRMRPTQALADLNAVMSRQAASFDVITTQRLMVGAGARTMPSHLVVGGRHKGVEARRGMENSYATLLVDHGPLGLAFFLAFLFGGWLFMWRSLPRITDRVARDDLRAVAAGVAGCAVLLLFSDAIYSLPVMVVFWSAMGLGIGIALTQRTGPKSMYRLVHFRHKL